MAQSPPEMGRAQVGLALKKPKLTPNDLREQKTHLGLGALGALGGAGIFHGNKSLGLQLLHLG